MQQTFELQLFVALHHLHAAATAQGDADAEVVVNFEYSIGISPLGGNFDDSICGFYAVEGACHSILEDLDLFDVGRIERQEGIRRDDLSVHDVEGFVGRISGSER